MKSRVMKCMCSCSDLLQSGEGRYEGTGKGLSSACAGLCVHARVCNVCVGQRTENHWVGEGGVQCWWWNEFHRACFLSTGPASSLWLLPGQWLGNYEECLETISFCWAHGWSKRGWMAFLYFFFIFSRLERQVAVVTKWRSPAHLHHKQGILPAQT